MFWKLAKRISAVMLFSFIAGCGFRVDHKKLSLQDREKETYEIYSLILKKQFDSRSDTFFISKQTDDKSLMESDEDIKWHYYKNPSSPVSDVTIANSHKENKTDDLLSRKFDHQIEYTLVDESEMRRRYRDEHSVFRSACFVSFSKVGFSEEDDQAIVSVAMNCYRNAYGMTFLLAKEGNVWKIIKQTGGFEACG